MLRNFYKKGWDSWQKGLNEAPYAFLIPENQGDPKRVAQLVGRLIGQHIEVARASSPLKLKDGDYPAGTYVVRLDQPYRNYAIDLLTPQHYPKDGSEPYDDVSWELPAHYRLNVSTTADVAVRSVALSPLTEEPRPNGTVEGSGPVFLLRDTGQEGLLAARYQLAKFGVKIAEGNFSAGGKKFSAGSWILTAQDGLADSVRSLASDLGLEFVSVPAAPDVPQHARSRGAVKRGAGVTKLAIAEEVAAIEMQNVDLIALDTSLTKLEQIDPQQCRIVELRFFSGLSIEDTADALSISPATVKRDWAMAKAWLYREISGSPASEA